MLSTFLSPDSSIFLAGYYIYIEVSSTDDVIRNVSDAARIISPNFPKDSEGVEKCLVMAVSAYGRAVGDISVLDEYGNLIGTFAGVPEVNQDMEDWFTLAFQLDSHQKRFVLEATKGGINHFDEDGDICLDNLRVLHGLCSESFTEKKTFVFFLMNIFIVCKKL